MMVSGWVQELVHDIVLVGMMTVIVLRIWTKFIIVSISRYKQQNIHRYRQVRYYIPACKRHRNKHAESKIANKRPIQRINWITACTSTQPDKPTESTRNSMPFDTDSFQIAIDNCATSHFTNNLNDFVKKTSTNSIVRGIGNGKITTVGTVQWTIQDDQGRRHTFQLNNVYYQPSLPWRLLSPQRLAQDRNDFTGTGCLTLGQHIELFWSKRQYKKTIPLTKSNIGLMYSAPSNKTFYAFAATVPNPPSSPHLIPFDESELESSVSHDSHSKAGKTPTTTNSTTSTPDTIEQEPVL